jgi:dTDP-4-amino-4,6-dideoxygalactose transaminase
MAKTAIPPGEFHYHGYTALLDNVQAAVLDIKLRHSPQWIEYRRQIAMLYRQGLQEMKEITLPHFERP